VREYDGRFKKIFQEVYESDYFEEFSEGFLDYEHRNTDDMTGQLMKA
jgi:isocitrate dehydrogenase